MNFKEYEKQAMSFAQYHDPSYPFYALMEEVGELMGKIAKLKRDPEYINKSYKGDEGEYALALEQEAGDILWDLTACCKELGFSLEDAAGTNLQKLTDRADRNVIKGEGDNR